MARLGRRSIRLGGVAVGVAVTLMVAALDAAGSLDDFEYWLLDKRFRYCNPLPPTDRIVHIDIGDDAIDRIGAWPWPREYHADLIRTLAGLGAKYIVFDLEFSEKKAARCKIPDDPNIPIRPADIMIDDDGEFVTAIREAGNVILPLSFEIRPPGKSDEALRAQAEKLVLERPDITPAAFAAALGVKLDDPEAVLIRTKIESLLRDQFALDKRTTAQRLRLPEDLVDKYFAGAKRIVARELADDFVDKFPRGNLSMVVDAATPYRERFRKEIEEQLSGGGDADDPPMSLTGDDLADLDAAFDAALSEWVVLSKCQQADASTIELPSAGRVLPPRYEFGVEAAGFGFVAFDADSDGVVRRTPLFIRLGDRLIPQLGYGVALRLQDQHRPLSEIPLDGNQKAIIAWPDPPPAWDSSVNNFLHLPVARVLELAFKRRAVRQNDTFVAQVRKALDDRQTILTEPPSDWDRTTIEAELARREANLRAALKEYAPPTDGNEPFDYEASFRNLQASVERERQNLTPVIEARERELRPLVKDRVCLVGYTARAIADMKPTAIYPDLAPGVLVHSAVINQTLADRWIRPRVRWEGIVLVLAAGVLVTAMTAWLNPYLSLAGMIGFQIVVGLVNGFVLFRTFGVWVEAAGPLLAVAMSWAAVTLYRQLTEERKKRQFASALSQYVSSAVAKRIADDLFDLAPVAGEVTCFFSDLKGFTSISERLGPAGTRDLLNPYLERMSGVLHAHGALINKFMGDGIFAFFNPPILPCEDHAAAACRAALACQSALDQLKNELAPAHPDATDLSMRVGISTGHVFVGDYGSENKRDYTCIGDTVNLAARLEPANKAFATRIMVADSTHRLVEDEFEFRYLGGLQVVGKKQAIGVYELLGAKGDVPTPDRDAAAMFSGAVEAFQLARWDDAKAGMAAYLKQRPDDAGAERYLALIDAYRREGPPTEWNGAVVLTEK